MKKALRAIFVLVLLGGMVSFAGGLFMSFGKNSRGRWIITATPQSALMTVFGAGGLVMGAIGASICSGMKPQTSRQDGRVINVAMPDLEEERLCPNCMTPNNPMNPFCENCRTPLTSYAEIAPLERIYSMGDTLYKVTHRKISKGVTWAVVIFFGPQIVFMLWLLAQEGVSSENAFSSAVVGFTILIYSAIIYKTVRSYLAVASEEVSEDIDEEPDDDYLTD